MIRISDGEQRCNANSITQSSKNTTSAFDIPQRSSSTFILFLLSLDRLLNRQLNLLAFRYSFLNLSIRQRRLNPLLQERIHLFRCPTDEALRVQEFIKMIFDRVEVSVFLDPIDEIVLKTEVLDLMTSFMREDLDPVLSMS